MTLPAIRLFFTDVGRSWYSARILQGTGALPGLDKRTLERVTGELAVRQGHFEEDPGAGKKPVYRLRWLPEQPLSEAEKRHAEFVRFLIARGDLNELTEVASP
jgi:hypothetical protein